MFGFAEFDSPLALLLEFLLSLSVFIAIFLAVRRANQNASHQMPSGSKSSGSQVDSSSEEQGQK